MAELDHLVVVTDATQAGGRPVLDVCAAAVDGGARTILVRDKQLDRAARTTLATGLRRLLDPVGGVLLVASDADVATDAGADGVHLAAADGWPAGSWSLVGRSCHRPEELVAAATEGCAYALLSPIWPTASKPGYGPSLGPGALAGSPLPVWALGGVTTGERAASCRRSGAAGVAVMGAVMRSDDPGGMVRVLRACATPVGNC